MKITSNMDGLPRHQCMIYTGSPAKRSAALGGRGTALLGASRDRLPSADWNCTNGRKGAFNLVPMPRVTPSEQNTAADSTPIEEVSPDNTGALGDTIAVET